MADTSAFESRAAQIDKSIDGEVAKIRTGEPLTLPARGSPIVKGYVQKIEGTYNVERAKIDTDNAIDLLYIAYNTTPQEESEIRIKISAIMDKLIEAQSDSVRALADAMTTADNVISDLSNALPDWLDVKDENDADEIKAFVGKDLLKLATDIKTRAAKVETKLNAIAKAYDQIIKDTTTASDASEKALAGRLQDQAAIRAEVEEAEAESQRLESLINDLKESFKTFEARAKEYQSRAETAESRAFIMQIVKIGAQVVSSAMPAIAMALGAGASGGTSVIAANTLSTLKQATGSAKKDDPPDTDVTAKVIKTKDDISKKKKEYEAAEKKTVASKGKVEDLRKDLKKAQEAAGKPVEVGTAKETEETPADGAEIKGVKGRLKDAKKELKDNEDETDKLAAALAGLQAGLKALADGLGELSQEQKDEAANLRELQMKMLDKAEAYEKERREQAASLVKINALLKGKLSKEETIKLAIKSLNISVSALKRTKEIVEEIAFFFKSFADFMHQVAEEAKIQIDLSESAAAAATLRKNRLADTIKKTDEFFIRQAGEWHAANVVSDHFNRGFTDGHSKLNRLRGAYIVGEDLKAYLTGAAVRLREIADAREDAAKARLVDLAQYRKQLRDDLLNEDVA
jgi:chromosome segregation ATPase